MFTNGFNASGPNQKFRFFMLHGQEQIRTNDENFHDDDVKKLTFKILLITSKIK
jgi:hypothetical protein